MQSNIKLIGGLCLLGLLVIFVIQNVAVVEVRFLFWRLAMSRSLMFFLIFCLGVIAGWFFHGHVSARRRE